MQTWLALRLGFLLARIDTRLHTLHVHSPRWLCLAADVSYGWGPDCEDWDRLASRFHRWLWENF